MDRRRFGPPKSSTSYRNIPLGEVAVRALADNLGTHPALEPEGIVFHTGARPLSRKRIHEIWRRALSKEVPCPQWANERAVLGVRKPLANWLGRSVTPHDLRHFYASALIRQGADVKLVQARLGHKSAQTTIDIYGHLWPDSDERTRTAIDAVFDRPLAHAADGDAGTAAETGLKVSCRGCLLAVACHGCVAPVPRLAPTHPDSSLDRGGWVESGL